MKNEYEELTQEEINSYVNNVEVPDLWDRISASYDKEIALMQDEKSDNNVVSFEKEKKKRSAIWKRTMVSVAAALLVVAIAVPIMRISKKDDSDDTKDGKNNTDKLMDIEINEESAIMGDYDFDITKDEIVVSDDAESESVQEEMEISESDAVNEDVTRIPDRIKVTAYHEQQAHEFTNDEVEELSDILALSELTYVSEKEKSDIASEYTIELLDDTGASIKLEITDSGVNVTLYVPYESGEEYVEYGMLDDNTVTDLYEYVRSIFEN